MATQTNIYKGILKKISQRHRLCTHNRVHNLDYVSNDLDYVVDVNLQLLIIEEGLKDFRREAGENPPREVGKRVRVRAYKPK